MRNTFFEGGYGNPAQLKIHTEGGGLITVSASAEEGVIHLSVSRKGTTPPLAVSLDGTEVHADKTYLVGLDLEVTASTPRDAAQKALKIAKAGGPLVFGVWDEDQEIRVTLD